MNRSIDPKAKVLFRVRAEDGKTDVETLWAQALGSDRYRIDNSPFFACGVSLHDIVLAPADPAEGMPTFQQVLAKSGNRTVRVFFNPPVKAGNASDKILQGLVAMGCGYEGAYSAYTAINIPSGVDLVAVCDYLIAQDVQWEHCDPTYEELFGGDA
jgi:Domain of unknown function (DUF4265)